MKTRKASHRNPTVLLALLCLLMLLTALSLPHSPLAVVSARDASAGSEVASASAPANEAGHPAGAERSAAQDGRGKDVDHSAIEEWIREEVSDCEAGDEKFVGLPASVNLGLTFFRPRLEHANGWIYPAGIGPNYCGYCSWRCQNPAFGNQFHLAQDMCNPQGDPVYAVDYGEVIHSQCVGSYGGPSGGSCGGAIAIQHRAKDGTWFTALYGHLDNYLPVGARVYAGDIVGFSNNWNPPHVHFGVRLGVNPDPANWFRGYTPDGNNYGFTNPQTFLDTQFACKNGTSVNFRPNSAPPVHPNGTLIRSVSDPTKTVYLLRNGQKQGIVSPEVLRNLYPNGGFDFKDVIVIAQDEFERYPTGPAISSQLPHNGKTHAEGRLIKRNPGGEISIVTDNGTRRGFVSSEVFQNLGYLFCNVADATAANYDSYPVGPPVTGASTTTQCSYSISPSSRSFDAGGGSGSVSVFAGAGCAWTASSNASWLTITSGGSGSGNGTVNYSVAANSGTQRTGSITISGGGQSFTHSVTQSGGTINQNPTPRQISDYADQLSTTYKVPGVVIKGMLEQESGWRQFDGNGNTVIRNEPDGRIGIGMTQVTVHNTASVTIALGVIQSGAQGSNTFTTATQSVSVDVNRLKTDWQYNMEVGVRVLVAKKVISAGAGDDASILENWYYPLAYYNGAVKGGANDPNNSSYSRTVASGGDWVSVGKFPYQERVFNIIAQLYPIPTERRSFYGSPIKVTLPGPSAVASGAGQYNFVEPSFCFYDWAVYYDDGRVQIGNWGNQNNGCILTAKTRTGIAFHKVQFGAPSSIPSPPSISSPGTGSEPGASIQTTTPTFQWGASAGAISYSLFVSKWPYGSSNIVYSNTTLTGTSFTMPSGLLTNGEKYRWNMTASNAAGESGVSNTLYFTVSTPTPPTSTLTVASSNPGSGVNVAVSPNDNSGLGNGTTQFSRTYNNNTSVTLTAPPTAGGNNFQRWLRDGAEWSSDATTSVTMDASHTMTAVYTTPPPVTRTLKLTSVDPATGVNITAAPNDNNGTAGGLTQFTLTYNNNTSVTLTAPATTDGKNFQKWLRDGVDLATTRTVSLTASANHTLTAVYSAVPGNSVYDAVLKAPKCGQLGSVCDSGTLLNGRGNIAGGPEPNQPNTIHNSCADSSAGTYHVDESIDRLRVSTLDGSNFGPGKTVKIEATVWAFGTSNSLDLFYAADANNPNWVYLTTLVPTGPRGQTLTTTYTLPSGGNLQAIRGNFRFQSEPSACSASAANFEDRDDLIFAASPQDCSYVINPSSASASAQAAAGSINITSQAGCVWTAVSNSPWLTITSGNSGTGSGVINYSVAANPNATSRTGTITIATQTFTVNQAPGGVGGELINVASALNGATAMASSTLDSGRTASAVINGDRKGIHWGTDPATGSGWHDATQDSYPDWVEVSFAGSRLIRQVDVFTVQDNFTAPATPTETMTFTQYGITDFHVQYLAGSDWVDVPNGLVTNNNRVWRKFTFDPISTSKIRILVNGALTSYSRIAEVEAWGQVPSDCDPLNKALACNGATAVASSTLNDGRAPLAAINGDRRGIHWGTDPATGSGWHDATDTEYPDWLQVNFNGTQTIGQINVYTLQDSYLSPAEPNEATTFSRYGITDFRVQYWSDFFGWVTVGDGAVTGNNRVKRTFTFPAVTTDKIRVDVTGALAGYSRIVEVEAYGPKLNVAAAANGATAVASSTLDDNRPASASINGDRMGLHWGSDPATGSGWHDATNNLYPDWLEIAFGGSRTITEVDIFSVQDNFTSPLEPNEAMTFSLYGLQDFDIEYWTGSAWQAVPGGIVVGNTKVWRKVNFAPLTTRKIRVVAKRALAGHSRITEVEVY